MQVFFKNGLALTVNSFAETLSFRSEQFGKLGEVDLMININQRDSVETLIAELPDIDFSTIIIRDLDGNERVYTNFEFANANQAVSDFNQITTSLLFTKIIKLYDESLEVEEPEVIEE
jgi:hypothetical protein